MRDIILCLSLGVNRCRATALDANFNRLDQASRQLSRIPSPHGGDELSPDEIRDAALSAAKDVAGRIGLERLAGIGILNESETVVVWERGSSRPLIPALLPTDPRGHAVCERLKHERKEPMLHYRTGLFLSPALPAAKIAWILENVPGARNKAANGELACGTLESWLLWSLTRGGIHATDTGNAGRTMLYDLSTRHWEAQLLAAFGIPASILPRVLPNTGPFGEAQADILGSPLPILAMASAASAGLFAFSDAGPAGIYASYGKRLFFRTPIGAELKIPSNLSVFEAWSADDKPEYALEVRAANGGLAVQWLQYGLEILKDPTESEKIAFSVPNTGGVYFVPALAGLGTPYLDPFARGLIIGLSPQTTRAHIIRAALEGIAFQALECIEAMVRVSKKPLERIFADGEAAANNFLLQFQADILGLPVERASGLSASELGAARMASNAAGLSFSASHPNRVERVFKPLLKEAEREHKVQRWKDAVGRSLNWAESGDLSGFKIK